MIKIDAVYLSTGFPDQNGDGAAAKKFLDDNGVSYTHLHYGDDKQWVHVFSAFNTWENYVVDANGNVSKSDVDKYFVDALPVLHFDVVNDDYTRTRVLFAGLPQILDSNIVALSKVFNGG